MRKGGEFQLPDALRALTEQGDRFLPGEVSAWMDCGNRKVTVETNGRVLEFMGDEAKVHDGATVEDSIILPPCEILPGAVIRHSVVGPRVTVGRDTAIDRSVVRDSLIGGHTTLDGVHLDGAMIGHHARVVRRVGDLSVGDYCEIE